jgi:hypothetical protein
MKFNRPDLVLNGYTKPSKRQKAYPFIVAGTVIAIIVLVAIKECR